MKNSFIGFILFFVSTLAFGQPVLRNFFTTNTTAVIWAAISNAADSRILLDTNIHQLYSTNLGNLSTNNGQFLTNIPPTALTGTKYSGVITNLSTLKTNVTYVTNGVTVSNIVTYP